jgi:hypothetical protein
MRIRTHRAILLVLLLLLPLAPVGADSGGSLKDLATVVETVARDISVTTVLMLAYERLDQPEDAGKAKEKIGRALLPRLMDTKADMRVVIARVFKQFWPGMYQRSGYDPTAVNFPVRYKAYKMWRQYLTK